ncbi:MAG: hypothetical protein QNL94_00385 [Halioglobus sp.]|jgi:hypothetical protein|tara:strand:+ start:542 stop:889 length:348 start_codon:yes stop_codon:yes gene_type:complete
MAMKLVKKTAEYSIYKRGDERYAVKDANKKAVNGEEKARILLAEDLIKVTLSAMPVVEEEAAVEAPAEEAALAEAPVEEAAVEEAPVEEEAAVVEEAPAAEEAPAEAAPAEEEEK